MTTGEPIEYDPVQEASASAPPEKTFSSAKPWAFAFVLVVLTCVAYIPAMRAGFVWDDDVYVTENPLLTAPDGLRRIWFSAHKQSQYFPLVYTTLRFEYALWGLNPIGYHVVNILLHCLNAVLVWMVLKRLALPGAWLAAAVWAVHPVNVESVAWITELKNTESTFFCLLALLAWMKFAHQETVRPWRYYALALLLYPLALFSKTTASTLPAALLLVVWLWNEPIGWRRFAQVAPFVVLGLAMGLLSVWWESHLGNLRSEIDFSFNGLERLLIATRALWFYAGKLLWPTQLTFSYPRWVINALDPLQYTCLLGCIAVALLLWWRRNTWGRAPAAAIVFFVATLSPMLGFIPLYTFRFSFVADHYQYVASIGLIALVVSTCATIAQRAGRRAGNPGMLAAAIMLLELGALTWRQSLVYRGPETLWRDTVAKNPDAWLAYGHLGYYLCQQGKLAEAIAAYETALRIHPDYLEAHDSLGLAWASLGEPEKALAEFKAALQIEPNAPGVRNHLGVLLASLGKIEEAIAEYQKELQINSNNAAAWYNLGNALATQNRLADAATAYQLALQIDPRDAATRHNLGSVLAGLRKPEEAAAAYQAALQIDPNRAETWYGLGNALADLGKLDEAATGYQAALRIRPDDVAALNNLATVLARRGKVEEAIAGYQQVVRIQPDYLTALYSLGILQASQGKTEQAIARFREALRLRPDWPPALSKLAWLLSTSEQAGMRNGAEAGRLAERLGELTGQKQADALMVLAAAYAEAGRFGDAARVAQQAVELARANGQQELAARIEGQLRLYQAGRPYRAGSASPLQQ